MVDRGILACYLLSPLSEIINPEYTSHFKLIRDPASNRVIDLLSNKTTLPTLYDNLLILRDKNEKFDLHGDFLKIITTKKYNLDIANSRDRKLLHDFAKEIYLVTRLWVIQVLGIIFL